MIALLIAFGVAFYLRAKAPPEAARLLPECDAIAYVHLKEIRAFTRFDQTPVERSPELQRFIAETGIVPERDIDAAALALHRVASAGPVPAGQKRGPSAELYVSEVFVGRFDGQRLQRYLESVARSRESYAGREIYSVPIDGQTLRVAQLGYDTIAASNMPTSEQIHSMIDRSRASGLGTPGSSVLAAHFHEVPLLAQAWGIGRIGLPFSEDGYISVLGLQLPLPEDTDLVASLGYNRALHLRAGGSVHLRVEEIAPSESAAQSTIETLTTVLGVLRGIGSAQPTHDAAGAAVRAILDSINLQRRRDRALLNATATVEELKILAAAHDPASAASASPAPLGGATALETSPAIPASK